MSAVGNILTLIIRKPVANKRIPPTALKSLIMAGVVSGKIKPPQAKRIMKMINCGIEIGIVTAPKVVAKIIIVNKSRMDFVIRIL